MKFFITPKGDSPKKGNLHKKKHLPPTNTLRGVLVFPTNVLNYYRKQYTKCEVI